MKLGRLILLIGIVLAIMTLTSFPVFAVQGGNGNGKAGENGQGAEHANENSAAEEGSESAIQSESDSETSSSGSSSSGSSVQICDGDSGGNSDTGSGANQGTTYDNTCPNGPSGNGNGGGDATGKPCAGCVGQADDKNPPGQEPGPQDHNNGYECDGNKGIAKTNPAHTGCVRTTTTPSFGYLADVPSLPCGGTSLTVSMTNQNNSAGGSRTFLVKLDGTTVDTVVLAAGASGTSAVTIPSDSASHSVSVETGSVVADTGTSQVQTVCSQVGAAAAIADLPCGDPTADVTASNQDAAGIRSFTAAVDGAGAGSASVAAGASSTFAVNIPNDGATHALTVASNGATLASKSLKVTSCSTTQVLGVQFSKGAVLGGALPRTGFSSENMLIVSMALIGIGIAMQVDKKKIFAR